MVPLLNFHSRFICTEPSRENPKQQTSFGSCDEALPQPSDVFTKSVSQLDSGFHSKKCCFPIHRDVVQVFNFLLTAELNNTRDYYKNLYTVPF